MSIMSPENTLQPIVQHLPASQAASTVLGDAIDAIGADFATVILMAGVTATSGTLDVTVESSIATGGTYAAITGAAFAQVTPSNDNAIYVGRIRLHGKERFLKVSAVTAVAASIFSTVVILSKFDDEVLQTVTYAFEVN